MMSVVTDDEIFEAVRASAEPDLPPVATSDAVAEAEEAIGYPIPPLLRRLYLQVANGGFGPQGGIIGVRGYDFWRSDTFADITESAVVFRAETNGRQRGMVQLLDWGCAIASVLDCRDPAGAMWGWDPNGCCLDHALFPQDITFSQWLAESIGRDYQEPFGADYFKEPADDDARSAEPIRLDGVHPEEEPEDDQEPCPGSPPVWVNGRPACTWERRPGADH